MMAFQSTIIFHIWLSWKGIPTQKIATMIVLKTVVGMGWLATYLYLIQTNIHMIFFFFLGRFCIWIANWCMSRWNRKWNGLPPQLSEPRLRAKLPQRWHHFWMETKKLKSPRNYFFLVISSFLICHFHSKLHLTPKLYMCVYEYLLPPFLFICL